MPYPYRAAVSVSCDAEGYDAALFEAMSAFLNGRGRTPFGMGLGLEITSSMFFHARAPFQLAYFSGMEPGAPRSPHADRLDEYLRAGWIDTNHAFGDFDDGGGFTRAHALGAYETLARLGARLSVFTNHGGTDNAQNVGVDADYHRGDRPGDPARHSDLFHENGVRFVWSDGLYLETPSETVSPALHPMNLRDGTPMYGFTRLRGTGGAAPNLSSLGRQLDLIPWERLYAENGVAVIYQHPGVLSKNAGRWIPATIDAVRAWPEVCLAPYRRLARERDEGRLWVAGTARLLRYAEAIRSFRISGGQGIGVITLHDPEPDGSAPPPDLDPAGLTLYIDPGLPVRVVHRGGDLPIHFNGPDESGRCSVTVIHPPLPELWP